VIDNRGGAGRHHRRATSRRTRRRRLHAACGLGLHAFVRAIIYSKLPYDPIRDFTPISLFAIVQNLLVINLPCRPPA